MATSLTSTAKNPDGSPYCSTVFRIQALTIKDLQPWLDQMIQDANPFPS